MTTPFKVPLIIRGQIIDDYAVEFGGRKGDVAFVTPDINKYLNQLIACPVDSLGAYQNMPVEEIARFLDELGKALDFDKNADMRAAYELSVHTSGISASILEFMYRNVGQRMFQRDEVLDYIEKRVGKAYLEGWVDTPLRGGGVCAVRGFGAKSVHIIAGNLPTVSMSTVLRAAVTRSDCITKMPSNDPLTMAAVVKTMIQIDPNHPITRHMSAVYWKGGDEKFESRLYHPDNIEKIVAWGGFDSIKHITKYLQPGIDLITLDPKHSGSIIGREALRDDATMREVAVRAAMDVGVYNQEACANARVIYVECDYDDADELARLNTFGQYVYQALQTLPSYLSTPAKYVQPVLKEELDGLFMMEDWYKLYRDNDYNGAVIVSQSEEPVGFAAQLACRTCNLVPMKSIDAAVARINSASQTIGVWPLTLKRQIRDALAQRGAQVIVALGYVPRINSVGPWDGIEPERRMLKWVIDDTPSESAPGPWVG
jgi:hypothetical protein